MTRKRHKKLLMAAGVPRNEAERQARWFKRCRGKYTDGRIKK